MFDVLPLFTTPISFILIKLMLNDGHLGKNPQHKLDIIPCIVSWANEHPVQLFVLFVHRSSLERLYQASLPLSEVNSVPSELISSHQALLREAWTRLHHLQEYQAFGEALRAVADWLEEMKTRLEKLESTEGNKEEVEERLERVQVWGDRLPEISC